MAIVLIPLIGGDTNDREPEARQAEAVGLAAAIGLDVVAAELVRVRAPKPATLFSNRILDDIDELADETGAGLVIVDGPLTPVQQRNLERRWSMKVIDRTGLILEIFGARAQTAEGKLQVELAALQYQRSRLVRSWTHLERQRGGLGFIGGPGESQLEIDRRLIDTRIDRIRKDLEQVRRTRGLHRDARARVPYPVIALVGYTNAGKSTLFNRLSGADVMAEDLLFATLDPTMRAIDLAPDLKVIMSDTVGFVSNLPTTLVAAFRATLEEVTNADWILHVRDVSHIDTEAQRADVEAVLTDLGIDTANDPRLIEVLNKTDQLAAGDSQAAASAAKRRRATEYRDRVVSVSAMTGEGCDDLIRLLATLQRQKHRIMSFTVPFERGEVQSWLYDRGQVLERDDTDTGLQMVVALTDADFDRFVARFPDIENAPAPALETLETAAE
ncbi:MAG: GTPase HflX [Alphaproteobacteria bacterium]|nr:GTPase HflX [Alphaproteobacteria bacterium SS10]